MGQVVLEIQRSGPLNDGLGPPEEFRRMYAIFEDGSHQFRVREGDHIHVDHRAGKAGDELVFPSVLVIAGGPSGLALGTPLIDGAQVVATIVNQFRAKKIIVQKFRRRKNMRRKRGHRQRYTTVRISRVVPPQ